MHGGSYNPYFTRQVMSGSGYAENIKSIYDAGKTVYDNREKIADGIKKISNVYTSELGNNLRNRLPNSDETGRPGYPGEQHAILKLKNGKYGTANYLGPNTAIYERLQRGDPPRSEVDRAAMAHDIRYRFAKTPKDIRDADNIMYNKVVDIANKKSDNLHNITLGRVIKAKTTGEDLGLINKNLFSGDLSKKQPMTNQQVALLNASLQDLTMQGYGKMPAKASLMKMLPGDKLKLALLKNLNKKKCKSKKLVGKGLGLAGRGLRLSGQGYADLSDIVNIAAKNIIPGLFKKLGLQSDIIKPAQLKTIIDTSLNMLDNPTLPNIISQLSKTILPIVSSVAVKQMGGSGMFDIIKKDREKLLTLLNKDITKVLTQYNNKKPMSGSGDVEDFFKGFAQGFMSVFKPASKVLAPLLSVAGLPILGTAVGAIGAL
jgi:hypothetical protein